MRRTSRRLYFGASLSVALIGRAAAQGALGWPDTIDLLKHERSQADECASLLKDAGDKSAIDRGRLVYGNAKSASDGAIAGLEVALVQGYRPESLKGIQADLEIGRRRLAGGLRRRKESRVRSIWNEGA